MEEGTIIEVGDLKPFPAWRLANFFSKREETKKFRFSGAPNLSSTPLQTQSIYKLTNMGMDH